MKPGSTVNCERSINPGAARLSLHRRERSDCPDALALDDDADVALRRVRKRPSMKVVPL